MTAIPDPIVADVPHAPNKNCRAIRNGASASLRSFVSFEYVARVLVVVVSSVVFFIIVAGATSRVRRARRRAREETRDDVGSLARDARAMHGEDVERIATWNGDA
jgi:hypothetical protein